MAIREIIGKWFAFEVEKFMRSAEEVRSLSVSAHINVVVPTGLNYMCPSFSNQIAYTEPSIEALTAVFSEYNLNVRGKQLFQMLSRFLSYKGRFSNFTDRNLIEIALKQGRNELLERLVENINSELSVA